MAQANGLIVPHNSLGSVAVSEEVDVIMLEGIL